MGKPPKLDLFTVKAPPACATVALIGNPNTGKSTLFGKLVGSPQRVGNYPGVTVEKVVGRVRLGENRCDVIDLPGLYSLSPRSRDEMVAVDLLLGRYRDTPAVDVVVCVVDACNIERGLYLVSQALELALPTVVVLNKLDIARGLGLKLDVDALAHRLGVPVVCTRADRGLGVEELKSAIEVSLGRPAVPPRGLFPAVFEAEVERIEKHLGDRVPRWLVERLLLDTCGYLTAEMLGIETGNASLSACGEPAASQKKCGLFSCFSCAWKTRPQLSTNAQSELGTLLQHARQRLSEAGCAVPAVETDSRYIWTRTVLDGVLTRPEAYRTSISDRIDRILTHRIWGTAIFALVMLVVFQAVFSGAKPLIGAVEHASFAITQWIEAHMAAGAVRSLLADGVVGGVGAMVSFLPQILILFFFIAVLEECGYMSRAAFLMDRIMSRVGLNGRSFIPLLSSFACAVPGIMATRVIANDRDRLTTILVAPLMTCSARLPIYTLLIAAFIPAGRDYSYLGGWLNLQGLTLAALYLLGIVTAIAAALVLKKTILRGPTSSFLLELPDYKWPSPQTVLYRLAERGWQFVRCAGTMVLLVSVLVWAAAYYPHDASTVEAPFRARQQEIRAQLAHQQAGSPAAAALQKELEHLDCRIQAAYQHQSILARLGRTIEPLVKPLGWDWRIGCAVVASFSAREVVVATLGVIYNLGGDLDTESTRDRSLLTAKLQAARWDGSERHVFNVPVAMSIMVFYALCAQCAATLIVIKTETGKWRWSIFAFSYMTALAYLAALCTYQLGMLL